MIVSTDMLKLKTFSPALLLAATLLTAALAQGSGRWTTGAPMPSSRTEVAGAEVNGKIYVVGGFGGERELEIYDPSTDRWSRGTAIPRALHHAGAVGLGGKPTSSGASSRDGRQRTRCTNTTRRATAGSGWQRCRCRAARWRQPYRRQNPRVGGVAGAPATRRRTKPPIPPLNGWIALASVPTARDHLAAAVRRTAPTPSAGALMATIRAI
jgi:hypothetical protein